MDYGYIRRDYSIHPVGFHEYSVACPVPVWSDERLKDAISEIERTKSSLRDIAEQAGVPIVDQNPLPYCHAFSCVYAAMVVMAVQGQKVRHLSGSSIGGPVTGYRSKGAYIFDDLERAVKFGICDVDHYPERSTDNHWTPEAAENAAKCKVTGWWDLEPSNFRQTLTVLCMRKPVNVGLDWWGHAVTFMVPKWDNKRRRFGVGYANNWGVGFEDSGFGELWEGDSKSPVPGQQYAQLAETFS